MKTNLKLLSIVFAVVLPGLAQAATEEKTINVDETMVRQWNRFSDKVLALHKSMLAQVAHRTEVRSGGYTGDYFNDPDFYVEETYYARDDGRLLSQVKWEKKHPENVHVLEVYVYDANNRLVRDYLVAYLPWGRNAPIQAYINLHTRADNVRGFRQFDASGAIIYEQCMGRLDGQQIDISLESHQIASPRTEQKDYRHCFAGLPADAGEFLNPK